VVVVSLETLRQRKEAHTCGTTTASEELLSSSFWDLSPENLRGYTVVCLLASSSELGMDELRAVNRLTRAARVPLLVANTFGIFGYFIIDALEHCYRPTLITTSTTSTTASSNLTRQTVRFPSLNEVFESSRSLTPHVHKLWHVLCALWTIQRRDRRLPTAEDLPTLSSLTSLPPDFLQFLCFSFSILTLVFARFVFSLSLCLSQFQI
jgi:hypothetical protein